MEFVNNRGVNEYINEHGPEGLPVVTIEDEIVITGRYPTNEEFIKMLNLPTDMLTEGMKTKDMGRKSSGCDCKGGCC